MRDAGNGPQMVCKRRENGRKKTVAVIRLCSDELENSGKDCGDSFRILDLSEEQERDESKRQTMFMSIVMGA